ncbi:MAG TPA: hypothetical protein VER04_19040 [Polyangiaceae bacterium]|nr:hypothetical protein [Polyangiaceae bacterium]
MRRIRFPSQHVVASAAFLALVGPSRIARARHSTEYRSQYVLEGGTPDDARRTNRERSFGARPFMLELRTGVATIVGLFGASASFDPWSRLCVGAGFGANSSGMQVAGFARLRPLVFIGRHWARLHAVGLELGYSTGPYSDYHPDLGTDHSGEPSTTFSYDRVHWLQPQITYETRSSGGLNLLVGVGVAIPFAAQGYHCLDEKLCSGSELFVLPTFTVGLGWALGP